MLRAAYLATLLALCACASIERDAPTAPMVRPVAEKSYEIGKEQQAFVGASMVRVREYYTTTSSRAAATANSDFQISTLGLHLTGFKGQTLPIAGHTTYDGQRMDVVIVQDNGVMVDDVGHPNGKVINRAAGTILIPTFNIEPADVRFTRDRIEEVDKSKPYQNYELVYSGRTGDTIRLAYREFSPEDMARAAFFQDLTYPVGEQTIRFRNLAIEVIEATAEGIRFRVLVD